jgi:hypothetical protein
VDEAQAVRIDGELATFMHARSQPLHSWFPYLEGFSSGFVHVLRERFLPSATRVIDPFAGTGTTPLHLASLGLAAAYCEANPAMRFVIDAKARACAAAADQRARTAGSLVRLADGLADLLRACPPAPSLAARYACAFRGSAFFDDDALDAVLRVRSLCDQLGGLVQHLVTLAAISSLVPCSRLKRAGDLRFKTPRELRDGAPAVAVELSRQLRRIADELAALPPLDRRPELLCADAKQLSAAAAFDADGAITSPPYLNGTNYIRNTRLELWFLGHVGEQADLRRLRDSMVTAGINDVAARSCACDLPEVAELCATLEDAAYDPRIPRMVSAYFADMDRVFAGLRDHCRAGAVLCLDIGDSQYGGVHVATQTLLKRLLLRRDFTPVAVVPLRARTSKNGSALRQDVLVFQRAAARPRTPGPAWRHRWESFKAVLPHQRPPFSSRNWGHAMHSACSYHGKLKPALAHFLVEVFSRPGDVVADPFCGAGTLPFEAALQARTAVALDLSTLAFCVTSAKLRPPPTDLLEDRVRSLAAYLASARPTPDEIERAARVHFNGRLDHYFHPDTFAELLCARRHLLDTRDDTPAWATLMCALLHVLHGNRPYALSRRSHPVTPFAPTGPPEYKSVIDKTRAKLGRMTREATTPGGNHLVAQADASMPWPITASVDAIITSPPFFDSTRFYLFNWIRFWFSGWESEDFQHEPARYLEVRQKQSMDVYQIILARFREAIKPTGVVVLHLGRSAKCDMAEQIGARVGTMFTIADHYAEDVRHCERHGVRDKGTVAAHQYLILEPR